MYEIPVKIQSRPFAQGNRSVLSKSEKRLAIRAGGPELQLGLQVTCLHMRQEELKVTDQKMKSTFGGGACEILKGLVIIPEKPEARKSSNI